MRAVLEEVPTGDAGLQVKLQRLKSLVAGAVRDPAFLERAHKIVRGVKERDSRGEIDAVSRFVRKHVRYTRDPVDVELFTDPRLMLADADEFGQAFGDCDDSTALGAALYESLGYPTRLRVGGSGGGKWHHIWLDVLDPQRGWTAVDDTRKSYPVGTDPGPYFKENVTMATMPTMDGLGNLGRFKLKKVLHTVSKGAGLMSGLTVVDKATKKVRSNPLVQAGVAFVPGVGVPVAAGLRAETMLRQKQLQKQQSRQLARVNAGDTSVLPPATMVASSSAVDQTAAVRNYAMTEPLPYNAQVAQQWYDTQPPASAWDATGLGPLAQPDDEQLQDFVEARRGVAQAMLSGCEDDGLGKFRLKKLKLPKLKVPKLKLGNIASKLTGKKGSGLTALIDVASVAAGAAGVDVSSLAPPGGLVDNVQHFAQQMATQLAPLVQPASQVGTGRTTARPAGNRLVQGTAADNNAAEASWMPMALGGIGVLLAVFALSRRR